MYLTEHDRNEYGPDDLARVAECFICHEEVRVWPYDNGRGDEIELCADCADLFGWSDTPHYVARAAAMARVVGSINPALIAMAAEGLRQLDEYVAESVVREEDDDVPF